MSEVFCGVFKKAALFSLPLIVGSLLLLFLIVRTGEFTPTDEIAIKVAQGKPFLYGLAFSNRDYDFKLQVTKLMRPEVLVLGSSRMSQWRSDMFKPYTFYNAAGCIYDLRDYLRFLKSLGDPAPKVVVIGLDYFHLLSANDEAHIPHYEIWRLSDMDFTATAKNIFLFLKGHPGALFRHVEQLYGVPAIGFNAVEYSTGFRLDGSTQNGVPIIRDYLDPEDYYLLRARNGASVTQHEDAPDPVKLRELAELVDYARKLDIKLVAVSMPYAPELVEVNNYHEGNGWWRNYSHEMKKRFPTPKLYFFNFPKQEDIGGKPGEFYDAMHPSEPSYIRALLMMLNSPDFHAILPLLQEKSLRNVLRGASRLEAYRNDF